MVVFAPPGSFIKKDDKVLQLENTGDVFYLRAVVLEDPEAAKAIFTNEAVDVAAGAADSGPRTGPGGRFSFLFDVTVSGSVGGGFEDPSIV